MYPSLFFHIGSPASSSFPHVLHTLRRGSLLSIVDYTAFAGFFVAPYLPDMGVVEAAKVKPDALPVLTPQPAEPEKEFP